MNTNNILVITTIFNLILTFIFAQREVGDVSLGCPRGTYKLDNYCYSLTSYTGTFDECELACEMGGGKLAMVKSNKIHLFMHRLRLRRYLDYWIGISDLLKEGTWLYSDGSKLDGFSRWTYGEPNNAHSLQHCGKMQMIKSLQWDDDHCHKIFFFICQFEGENCTKSAKTLGSFCVELSKDVASYDDAQKHCQMKGGYLANTKTLESYNFVKNLIYNDRWWLEMDDDELAKMLDKYKNANPSLSIIRLGLKYQEQKWILSDGTMSKFTLWEPGIPSNVRNQGECVVMSNYWLNEKCNIPRTCACQYSVTSVKSIEERLAEDLPSSIFDFPSLNPSKSTVAALTIVQPSGMYLSTNQFTTLLILFLILGVILVPCVGGLAIYARHVWKKKSKQQVDGQALRMLDNHDDDDG